MAFCATVGAPTSRLLPSPGSHGGRKLLSRINSSTPALAASPGLFVGRRSLIFMPVLRRLGSRPMIGTMANNVLIDSHLHVWADIDKAEEFPFPGGEPPYPGSADLLLESMKEPGVHGALIVQPANHKFDHSYVSSVMAKHPGRFVGCLLADPTEGGGGVEELERLVMQEGYRAVRFNPYLWPEGSSMTDKVGQAMFKRAGELGVPVGIMTFKGLMLHIDDIRELCESYPRTKVILDHFAFCKCSDPGSDEWKALLGLAKFPQVYVKASAFFRVSEEPYPYMDARPMLRRLIDTFGSDKVMWGTDFPWITEQCGYTKAWQILKDGDTQSESDKPLLAPEEQRRIFGLNIMQLFPGAWY